MDMVSQAIVLGKKPHVIIATPGRLVDHLENTKGFTLRALKYLVMDEADRILNMDFEVEVDKILSCLPKEGRQNMLFSATMTKRPDNSASAAAIRTLPCAPRCSFRVFRRSCNWASRRTLRLRRAVTP